MCINPKLLPFGTDAWCRKCLQCRLAYVADWEGRNIAESKVATTCFLVTLTYGHNLAYGVESEAAASYLDYDHVQRFLKRLRKTLSKDKRSVRYFISGEYGTKKGRAHWHALLYFDFEILPRDAQTLLEEHWGHGFCNVSKFRDSSAGYVCKYIIKQSDTEELPQLHMSKKPTIGAVWIAQFARKIAQSGLALLEPVYWFSDVRVKKTGKPRKFYLWRQSRDLFISEYLAEWSRLYLARHIPPSDLVASYQDKLARDALCDQPKVLPYRQPPPAPWQEPPNLFIKSWNETLGWVAIRPDGARLFWSFDNEGAPSWQSVIRTETWAASRRLNSELRTARAYRNLSKGS